MDQQQLTQLPPSAPLARLQRVVLTDGVARTLFVQYLEHRASTRGIEEIGWLLLGLRLESEAVALATLPAGAGRDAGESHIRFHVEAQAVAARIVRQRYRQLTAIGLVHTHPDNMHQPSRSDLTGDQVWVRRLRGQEGVFAIGTADAPDDPLSDWIVTQPSDCQQIFGGLRFSWYALAADEADYRPLPVAITLGPDLAVELWPVWSIIERYAGTLDFLSGKYRGLWFKVLSNPQPMLQVTVPISSPGPAVESGQGVGESLGVRLGVAGTPTYGRLVGDAWETIDLEEPAIDRGFEKLISAGSWLIWRSEGSTTATQQAVPRSDDPGQKE